MPRGTEHKPFGYFEIATAIGALLIALAACQPRSAPPERPPDAAEKPAPDDQGLGPLGAGLRQDQVRTRHIINGTVTGPKIAYKQVTVTVNAAATTGSSAADTDLVGGVLVACRPNSNQDQHMDNVVLNADGSLTATLGVAATANNVFVCTVWKANAKGTF